MKKLYENKFAVVSKGCEQPYVALSLAYDYILTLNTPEEFTQYLHDVFLKVPAYCDFIDFPKFKSQITPEIIKELDDVLGQDFEDCGDCGYGSYATTNRFTLYSTDLSHCGGIPDHYYNQNAQEITYDEYTKGIEKLRPFIIDPDEEIII